MPQCLAQGYTHHAYRALSGYHQSLIQILQTQVKISLAEEVMVP